MSGRLSRFTVSGTTISGPETVLIEDWCQQFPQPFAGQLGFRARRGAVRQRRRRGELQRRRLRAAGRHLRQSAAHSAEPLRRSPAGRRRPSESGPAHRAGRWRGRHLCGCRRAGCPDRLVPDGRAVGHQRAPTRSAATTGLTSTRRRSASPVRSSVTRTPRVTFNGSDEYVAVPTWTTRSASPMASRSRLWVKRGVGGGYESSVDKGPVAHLYCGSTSIDRLVHPAATNVPNRPRSCTIHRLQLTPASVVHVVGDQERRRPSRSGHRRRGPYTDERHNTRRSTANCDRSWASARASAAGAGYFSTARSTRSRVYDYALSGGAGAGPLQRIIRWRHDRACDPRRLDPPGGPGHW